MGVIMNFLQNAIFYVAMCSVLLLSRAHEQTVFTFQ